MLNIIKIGGKVVENEAQLSSLLQNFHQLEGLKILVHGGGKKTSDLSLKLGIQPNIVEGRRVTDAATLEIAIMVYAGLFNKKIVSLLQALGCNALGLTGADLNVIYAHKRPVQTVDYGWVGDVDGINASAIQGLLEQKISPVFCAITHDGKGQLLNTNADTIAAQLAAGLAHLYPTRLILCLEKKGVLTNPDDDDSVLPTLSKSTYKKYKQVGVISAGMIPKLDNAFFALEKGVKEVVICNPEAVIENDYSGSTRVE